MGSLVRLKNGAFSAAAQDGSAAAAAAANPRPIAPRLHKSIISEFPPPAPCPVCPIPREVAHRSRDGESHIGLACQAEAPSGAKAGGDSGGRTRTDYSERF